MSRTVNIKSSKLFEDSYTFEDCKFDFNRWKDDIGRAFVNKTKSIPSTFNYKLNDIVEKAQPLAKMDDEQIKYESRNYDIQRLKVDG